MAQLLEGKVAVVTGAGRGLGRAHAIALANEGASVVVNDYGVAINGSGASKSPADEVVEEIRKAGGKSVANYDSVAESQGAQNIIKTAMDNFGKLDILVNNAGILRDRMVYNMTDEEWDLVLKTHLYGTFYCTRTACQIMRERKYGRIINTSSSAGMGNIGQANYSAAKEGIVGLTRTVARDMARYGITCNAVRPVAASRMNINKQLYQTWVKSVGQEKADEFKRQLEARKPEDVSPMVVFLATEQASSITACVFDVTYNYIAIYDDPPRFWRIITKKEGRWLPDELVGLMPKTLTAQVETSPPGIWLRITPDAKAWEWADKTLREVPPAVYQI